MTEEQTNNKRLNLGRGKDPYRTCKDNTIHLIDRSVHLQNYNYTQSLTNMESGKLTSFVLVRQGHEIWTTDKRGITLRRSVEEWEGLTWC